MIGILVSVLGVFFELASIYLLGFLVDNRQREPYIFDNILQENRSIFVFFITLLIISIIFRTLSEYYSNKVRILIEMDLRKQFLNLTLKLNWTDFSMLRTGELIKCILSECHQIGSGASVIMNLIANSFVVLVLMLVAFVSEPKATSAILAFGVIVFLTSREIKKIVTRKASGISNITNEIGSWSRSLFAGYKFFLANNLVNKLQKDIEKNIIAYATKLNTSQLWAVLGRSFTEIAAAVIVIVILGLSLMRSPENMAYALIVIAMISRVVPRIMAIQSSYFQAQINYTWLLSFNERFSELKLKLKKTPDDSGGLDFNHSIKFVDVTLSLMNESIIDNLNIEFEKQKFYAVTGPSGSGKSLLTELFMGLREPSSGEILVDGVPLTNDKFPTWRNKIVYLGQNHPLLAGDIRQNVTHGLYNVSDEKIFNVLSETGMLKEVSEFPEKINHILTEDGGNLSGGQKQRIGLASCLLRANDIIVLDEPTSALDRENASVIYAMINSLRGKFTILAITHDSSLYDLADVKIRCNDGAFTIET
jgi:ATP-binding cassette subfamily C protein